MEQKVNAAKRYFKGDFKLHVLEESPYADHCMTYALSDKDDDFKAACQHEHTMECDRCKDCKEIAMDILKELNSDISFRYVMVIVL